MFPSHNLLVRWMYSIVLSIVGVMLWRQYNHGLATLLFTLAVWFIWLDEPDQSV